MSKQVAWVVVKNDVEITRVSTKKMAEVIAHEVGGMVVKYTKE